MLHVILLYDSFCSRLTSPSTIILFDGRTRTVRGRTGMSNVIDSSESDDMEECMKVFLNGISISDMAWQDVVSETVELETPHETKNIHLKSNRTKDGPEKKSGNRLTILQNTMQQSAEENSTVVNEYWWTCACTNAPDLSPPKHLLQIVDHSKIGRGFALISKKFIPAGTVLYTERAMFACQVPEIIMVAACNHQRCADCHLNSLFKVRACQHCFRSLEPISSCSIAPSSNGEDLGSRTSFPLPELYPVPGLQWDSGPPSESRPYKIDFHGRIACSQCNTLFCSLSCFNDFRDQYNSCCLMYRTMLHLTSLLQPHDDVQENIRNQRCTDIGSSTIIDNSEGLVSIQPAIPLAIRMFVAMLQCYRTNRSLSNSVYSLIFSYAIINDLCGTSSNIHTLELGIPQTNRPTTKDDTKSIQKQPIMYSLEPIYLYLVNIYSITIDERQNMFSLEYLMSLSAKAARNSFGLRTQSPFQTYYAAIVRSHYTRGSNAHKQVQRTMAMALGSATGSFERGMDQKINDQVSPEIAAFYPLTSRINHSCSPNVQVRSQQFVDSHIDAVAVTDIAAGTEICISYIHIGRKSTVSRQRELNAKYMFQCTCTKCVPLKSI